MSLEKKASEAAVDISEVYIVDPEATPKKLGGDPPRDIWCANAAAATIKVSEKKRYYLCTNLIGSIFAIILPSESIMHSSALPLCTRPDVTHVVTELPTFENVKKYIDGTGFKGKIVNLNWFLDSNRLNKPQPETMYEVVVPKGGEGEPKPKKPKFEFDLKAFNACVPERKAVLNHPNKKLSEPLDFLSHYWEVMGTKEDENRHLAFMKAAAAVKCLPFKVTDVQQIRGVKDLGSGHAFQVVKDVLETGASEEVEEKKSEPEFIAIDSFAQVFNAGKTKAKEWYNNGFRSIWDLRKKYREKDNETDLRTMYGLAFYEDLTTPLPFEEGKRIYDFVCEEAQKILPGVQPYLIGGFRRGKTTGHDVDLLFTHDNEGAEEDLGPKLAEVLEKKNLVQWHHFTHSPENSGKSRSDNPIINKVYLTMTIFKYPLDGDFSPWKDDGTGPAAYHTEYTGKPRSVFDLADAHRPWKAVRVDFVTAPKSQWASAYMGWTGNKNYNRIFRHYAKNERGLIINNAGVYDERNLLVLPVKEEVDVFKHVGISYREPTERNF